MSMTESIPKRIIQVWGSLSKANPAADKSTDLPLFAQASAANLRLLNPDFEYVLFDDARIDELVDSEFPQYRPVFDSFSARIQRYDFFRYLSVYHFGGFYFDTDVFLASSLDDLLQFGCVFPFEELSVHSFLRDQYGMDWEIGNYAFGAAAGHPFLEAIIKNVVRAQQHPEWAEAMLKSIPRTFRSKYLVLDTTGPGLVSRTLAEYLAARDQVKVLFPDDVCDPDSWHRFGKYGVHLQRGSWLKRERLLYRVWHRYWESRTRKAFFRDSLERGGKRSLEFKRSAPAGGVEAGSFGALWRCCKELEQLMPGSQVRQPYRPDRTAMTVYSRLRTHFGRTSGLFRVADEDNQELTEENAWISVSPCPQPQIPGGSPRKPRSSASPMPGSTTRRC